MAKPKYEYSIEQDGAAWIIRRSDGASSERTFDSEQGATEAMERSAPRLRYRAAAVKPQRSRKAAAPKTPAAPKEAAPAALPAAEQKGDDSDDDKPKDPVTTAVESITGEDPIEIDRLYKQAWDQLRGDAARPPADVVDRLQEAHRRAHEAIVERSTRRSSNGERKPKTEFPPTVQKVLDFLQAQYDEKGADAMFTEKEMGIGTEQAASTIYHAKNRLIADGKIRMVQDGSKKRYAILPSAGDAPTEQSA